MDGRRHTDGFDPAYFDARQVGAQLMDPNS
ncbi:hypothetical protein P3T37_006068 [Kitasatospora sp. MAA4]|nr:hypothetical protein [Kitasatospora sp. MAA4]